MRAIRNCAVQNNDIIIILVNNTIILVICTHTMNSTMKGFDFP
jgi:hypothetical protein